MNPGNPPSVQASAEPSPDLPVQDPTIFYVGGESLGLTNLLMTNSSCNVRRPFTITNLPLHSHSLITQVFSYDPVSRVVRLESSRTNRLLMRRYAVVQKARDADVVGILVGTLGVGETSSPPGA